jgi:hypothetical protein
VSERHEVAHRPTRNKSNLEKWICVCYGVGLVSLLILALISPRSSFAQESLFLETDASVQNLPAQQSRSLEALKARPTSAAVHVMRLADTPAALLEQGKALTLNVSPGKSVVVVGKQVQQRSRSGISWAGPLQGENGWATLILTDKGITGTLRSGTPQSGFTFYRFEPIGDDLQAVVRVDASQFPSEHPPEYSTGALHKYSEEDSSRTSHDSTDAKADQNNQVQKEQSSSGGPYIDLLVVYTQAAANATSDINGLIQTTVTETNQSYQNSNIDLETTLAHSSQINYDETGRSYEDHPNTISDFSYGVGETSMTFAISTKR